MLQKFDYSGSLIRTNTDRIGIVWFSGVDVCTVLGYSNPKDIIEKILDEDEKKLDYLIDTSGQKRKTWTINESGLYHLIIKSTKPEAIKFRKWITGEVLPSLRKAGIYSTDQAQQREFDLQAVTKLIGEISVKIGEKQSELKDLKDQKKQLELQRDDIIVNYAQLKIEYPISLEEATPIS